MFNRDALFGGRGQQPPAPPPREADPRYRQQPQYGHDGSTRGQSTVRSPPMRSPIQLRPAKSPDNSFTFGNLCAVSAQDIQPSSEGGDVYLLINGNFVLTARPIPQFPRGQISLNDAQRTWMQIALTDIVEVQPYDPFSSGAQAYLGTMDVEVGFAGKKSTELPYDQEELAKAFTNTFRDQVFAPGQQLLMDFRSIPLRLTVRTVELVDLSSLQSAGGTQVKNPQARGIITSATQVNYTKDIKSPINLKGSTRSSAANSVIRPDFKFEDMGIGGLSDEFTVIFRRAFVSRIFPPSVAEKLGIHHVRGLLLYGPPGTGKTLIAREIGKMLNAREPKIVNGPEVLNKYVGQSEENIRKLFADAEKEQKEKGDESGLHIIIFDELDAVCKQRGSGAGGGTGVGDSIVNQLLSKLDGVNQLNNIILIGMTNRKDMIDEALLRAGRLEVHVEVNLPDEKGRAQILKIHTAKMSGNNMLGNDVDLLELARLTRNFSGAEISGLVRAATSFALQRHIKVGSATAVFDIEKMMIQMQDFISGLDEITPLFGANTEDLTRCTENGIIHFNPHIDQILEAGGRYIEQLRTGKTQFLSVLLYGPSGSGKTALAAKIATDSEFPFIRLIRPIDMIGMNELQKIQHLHKMFNDAYRSPLNVILIDHVDLIVDWVGIGPRFNSAVLAALKGLMSNKPPKGRSLLVLATTSRPTALQQLELTFDTQIPVPNVQTQGELANILTDVGSFEAGEVQRAIHEIADTTQSNTIGVGVKQILLAVDTAMVDKEDRVGRLVERICSAIHESS